MSPRLDRLTAWLSKHSYVLSFPASVPRVLLPAARVCGCCLNKRCFDAIGPKGSAVLSPGGCPCSVAAPVRLAKPPQSKYSGALSGSTNCVLQPQKRSPSSLPCPPSLAPHVQSGPTAYFGMRCARGRSHHSGWAALRVNKEPRRICRSKASGIRSTFVVAV